MPTTNTKDFLVTGTNDKALFSLNAYRGEGMLLLAMNWKKGKPTDDFVGFSIEYKEPGGDKFFSVMNRLSFLDAKGKVSKTSISTLQAPIQMFRWVHFPRNADKDGDFTYKVKPVFMNNKDELSYGESQQVDIQLSRETFAGKMNVCFTRGFVSSQAFVDKYQGDGDISTLLPAKAKDGLSFKPTHPNAEEALNWMGFESVSTILDLLDQAIADKKAAVKVVAYDLNLPQVVDRLEKLGTRLKIVIDDSGDHGDAASAESQAAKRLNKTSPGNVKREHMGQLQHNKTIVVDGPKVKAAIGGSTNFSWRGFYVQANNAIMVQGAKAVKVFSDAFDNYWQFSSVKDYGKTTSAAWNDLSLAGIDAKTSFSPHITSNAMLDKIAADMKSTKSSLFYSLAFLYQTSGSIRDTVTKLTKDDKLFVYGISDKKVGGLDIQKPNGYVAPVYPAELSKNLPEPFKTEITGGTGTRMHHKFVVIDFDKPTARVYMGSYNFSPTADLKNGENLWVIRDKKVAVSYMIEALRIFDHYNFRVTQRVAKSAKKVLALAKPPRAKADKPWWDAYYTDKRKIRDRVLFGS